MNGVISMEKPEEESNQNIDLTQIIINLSIESWRFIKVFERAISKLDAGEQARYISQLRWYYKKLEESLEAASLKLVNMEGSAFDIGMAVTPLNIADFKNSDILFIDQMMEPIIMGQDGLVHSGIVTLGRLEK